MTSSKHGTGSGAGTGTPVDIRSLWARLDPATRQWLLDHTGAAIVPRTITAALGRASDQPLPQDGHGQFRLTEDDMVFIRNQAHSAFAAHGIERFFEAAQPEHHRHDAANRSTRGTRPRA